MRAVRIVLLSSICLLLYFQARAQSPYFTDQIKFKRISIADGLSQSSVSSIMQDSKGFMWFGTQDGLNLYNGYNFKIFKNELLNNNSITSGFIHAVYQLNNGEIAVGTSDGFCIINQATGKIKRFAHNDNDSTTISASYIYTIYQSKQGTIFLGTNQGLSVIDPKTYKSKNYYYKKGDTTTIAGPGVYQFFWEDETGLIWFPTLRGMCSYDPVTAAIKQHLINPKAGKNKNDKIISCLLSYPSRSGKIWIGTAYHGLYLFDPNTGEYEKNIQFGEGYSFYTTALIEDSKGNVWVGTEGAGVIVYNTAKKTFQVFTENPSIPTSVSDNFIQSVYEDKNQNIWVGTWGGGVCLYNPASNRFKTIDILYNKKGQTIISNDIWGIIEDSDTKNFWIATYGEGVNIINKQTGNVEVISTKSKPAIDDDLVYSLREDKNNNIWIGTNSGLNRYNKKSKTIKTFVYNPKDSTSVCDGYISAIYCDSKGRVWVSSSAGGFCKYDSETEKFKRYLPDSLHPNASLPSKEVRGFCEDYSGNIWIATGDGVCRFNPESEKFKVYRHKEGDQNTLSYKDINCVAQDFNGKIWIGTSGGGLSVIDPKREVISFFTEQDGLPNSVVYGILVDRHGELWFSTNNGLCRLKPPANIYPRTTSLSQKKINLEIRVYDSKDGIAYNEFNQGAYFKSHDGRLYFGGLKGITYFNPDSMFENKSVAPVYITSVKVMGKQISIDSLEASGNLLELEYNQNFLSFDFVTLSYFLSEKNSYSYRMVGVDEDWVESGERRFASYPNLPPGNYVLKIKASNNDGFWNEEGVSLKIYIKPPFWKTIWFYSICAIVLLLMLFGYIKVREQNLKSQKKNLEKQVAERTVQLNFEKVKLQEAVSIIDTKNKEITDSIKYAKRIQEAILPPLSVIKNAFPESFVFYKPKDIVSGDFYFFSKVNKHFIFAVADCTGHGVPGAIMSMIGNDMLTQIVSENNIERTSDALSELDKRVKAVLRQGDINESIETSDGMDIALCAFNSQNVSELEYSGAYRNLLLINENDIVEYKADKFSIGGRDTAIQKQFTNHSIPVKKGNVIYLFTDGFPDQFGGPDGKKFKYKPLKELLRSICHLPMDAQKAEIEKTLEDWKGNNEQVDDILIMGIRF